MFEAIENNSDYERSPIFHKNSEIRDESKSSMTGAFKITENFDNCS